MFDEHEFLSADADGLKEEVKKAGVAGLPLYDIKTRTKGDHREDALILLCLLEGSVVVRDYKLYSAPENVQIPFSEVKPGERYEPVMTKRSYVGIKIRQIEVKDQISAGAFLPHRNAIILEVRDSGNDSVGVSIFEADDMVVTVKRSVHANPPSQQSADRPVA